MTSSIPAGFELCTMATGAFNGTVGPLFCRRTGEGLRFAFLAAEKHMNGRGVIHGGMLMTFADQVLGLTVEDAVGGNNVATISLNCDLIASGRPGDLIEGQASVIRVTKSVVFVRGTLCHGEIVLVNANGLWKRLSPQHRTSHG